MISSPLLVTVGGADIFAQRKRETKGNSLLNSTASLESGQECGTAAATRVRLARTKPPWAVRENGAAREEETETINPRLTTAAAEAEVVVEVTTTSEEVREATGDSREAGGIRVGITVSSSTTGTCEVVQGIVMIVVEEDAMIEGEATLDQITIDRICQRTSNAPRLVKRNDDRQPGTPRPRNLDRLLPPRRATFPESESEKVDGEVKLRPVECLLPSRVE